MRQTDQQPFALDLDQPAQHELAEAAHVFDLSEDWFDDRLATVINLASRSAFQFMPHLRPHSGVERWGLRHHARFWFIGWHIQIDTPQSLGSDHRAAEVSSVSRNYCRQAPQILL